MERGTDCKEPHTINVANVGSTRDLISQKHVKTQQTARLILPWRERRLRHQSSIGVGGTRPFFLFGSLILFCAGDFCAENNPRSNMEIKPKVKYGNQTQGQI